MIYHVQFTFQIFINTIWSALGGSKTEKCFCCEEDLENEFISLHKRCIDKLIKGPDCSDVVQLQNLPCNHECMKERTGGIKLIFCRKCLCSNYLSVLYFIINYFQFS